MISPETLRAHQFFAGFNHDQIVALATVAEEQHVDQGHTFIREGDKIDHFYLLLEGTVALYIAIPDPEAEHSISQQITREMATKNIRMSSLGKGEMVGWSAIVPPHESTATVEAVTACRVVAFDYPALRSSFGDDCCFELQLTRKAAQIIRQRLRDRRIELLSAYSE